MRIIMESQMVVDNKKGFTLIEFVVAVGILTFGLLGLLQVINFATINNLQNSIRQEAFQVADAQMTEVTSQGYQNVQAFIAATPNVTVPIRVANGTRSFGVSRSMKQVQNSRLLTVVVTWNYRNSQYRHEASTILSQ